MRVIRSSLAALLLAGAILTAPGAAAAPAPERRCPATPDIKTAAKSVDYVVLGSVSKSEQTTRGTGSNREQRWTYTVDLERVYQGKPETSPVTISSPASRLGLGRLPAKSSYLFFVNGAGDKLTAAGCSGSRPATDRVLTQVENQLGAGMAYVEPQPPKEKLAYEALNPDEPMPLSRLVAPGAGVALIGLLGLLLTGRRRRR